MTLADMRQNGVIATCEACGHAADVYVDALAETIPARSPARSPRQGADQILFHLGEEVRLLTVLDPAVQESR